MSADRATFNAARRWHYLPVRIATNRGRLTAYQSELAHHLDAAERDHKRIYALRNQIAGTIDRLTRLCAEQAAS